MYNIIVKRLIISLLIVLCNVSFLYGAEYNLTPKTSPDYFTEVEKEVQVDVVADDKVIYEELSEFRISKVNRIEKLWVIPPTRRNFMGSRGITKYDYARLIPIEDQGEDYVVTWTYRGKPLKEGVLLDFEYRTVKDPKEQLGSDSYVEKYAWHGLKRGTYNWTFENIGDSFIERGKVDRWKVSLIYGDKVVAEKRSATWRAMEGN